MAHQLKDLFEQNLRLNIDQKLAQALIHLVEAYETRGTNPMAFNSYMLGRDPCVFKSTDRDDFFDLFTVEPQHLAGIVARVSDNGRRTICGLNNTSLTGFVKQAITSFLNDSPNMARGVTAGEVRKWVSDSNAVNTNFAVVSDPLNLFITYVIHVVLTSKLPDKIKNLAAFKTLMFLQYKFFTSLVNFRYKYKPSEDAMVATFESLTNRYDIKVYGTWRKVMEARAAQLLDSNSIHHKTLVRYDDDRAILYFITDVQTRIRNQINLFTEEFMRIKDQQDTIGSYTLTGNDKEGEKIILDNNDIFDSTSVSVFNASLSLSQFLDDQIINFVAGNGRLFSTLNASTFRSLLVAFSEYAVKQSRANKAEEIKVVDGVEIDVGPKTLIFNIVQKSFRYCVNSKVPLNRPLQVLMSVRDIYSASRTSDPGILRVKASVSYLLDNITSITRESTISALRIGFIVYIIALAIKQMK